MAANESEIENLLRALVRLATSDTSEPDESEENVSGADHDAPLLLTLGQAARTLTVSEKTVVRLIKRGELRSVQLSPRIRRVPAKAIDEMLDRLAAKGTTSSDDGDR